MRTEDIDTHKVSTWIPTNDPILLSALGKLCEEAGELVSIISRIIIQGGLDECDPETGKSNREALQEELADVQGLSNLVANVLFLDHQGIDLRANKKYNMKAEWLEMLRKAA